MIKRVLWFVVGAAVGIVLLRKVRGYLTKSTPQAVGERVRSGLSDRAGGLGESAADFVDRARAAMAEREAELRDALGQTQESSQGQDSPFGRPQSSGRPQRADDTDAY